MDPTSTSMLSLYLRDVAVYSVMDPDEELEAARAVEESEIEHWVALLSYPTAVERVLDQLSIDIQSLPEEERPDVSHLLRLRELARHGRTDRELSPCQMRVWDFYSRALARAIRLSDADRLWVAHANEIVRNAVLDELTATRCNGVASAACRDFMSRVDGTDRAQRATKHHFVEANLRLVVTLARQYGRGSLPLIDAIQEGNIGLIKAVDRFDHTRGYRFSTFALWWIRHAISRAVADKGRAVRIPAHLLADCARAARAGEVLLARTGCAPTNDDLEQLTQIPTRKLAMISSLQLGAPLSIDREHSGESRYKILDLLADSNSVNPYESLEQKCQSQELQLLLNSLSPDEMRLIRLRFGLDEEELTLEELGEKYQLSREGIRRRLLKTLRRMRRQVRKNHKEP